MNIAFDMSFTHKGSTNGMLDKYSKHLIRSIMQRYQNCQFYSFYPESGWDPLQFKEQLEKYLAEKRIDLFHTFNPSSPIYSQESLAWFGKTKVAVMLQDLRVNLDFVRSCDLILVNSKAMKRDAIAAEIAHDKIKVIYPGVEKEYRITNVNVKDFEPLGIDKRYVVCTGGVDFRENFPNLIPAFAKANEQLNDRYQLVIVCKTSAAEKEQLYEDAVQAGISNHLVITGYLSDLELAKLYIGADLFVYPSLTEGFPFPVLAAMACGTPVIASDSYTVREVTGDAAILINPVKSTEIQAALIEYLESKTIRTQLQNRGLEQVEQFDWHIAGQKMMKAYQRTCRPKLAVFTPMPPRKTGAAEFIDTLLPTLSKRYRCDLFIDQGYKPDLAAEAEEGQMERVYAHHLFPEKANQYDEVLFQLGDSPDSAYILPYLQQYSGVVILHNLHLPGKDHLHKAKSIIVHNLCLKQTLSDEGFRNVIGVKLPVTLPIMIYQIYDRDFMFATFGDVTENKKIELIIQCMKRLRDQGIKNIQYTVVGDGNPEYMEQLHCLVTSLGLEDVVKFYAYEGKSEYQKRVSQSEICIQLQNPTNGETSGAVLDAFSHGKAAIVMNFESYSELPHHITIKISHDDQVEDQLFAAMLTFYNNKEMRNKMRQHARNYVVDHHNLGKYVDTLRKIIEERISEETIAVEVEVEVEARVAPEEASDVLTTTTPLETMRTLVLSPNRFRILKRGKKRVSYLSYNLNEIPPGCTIQSAVMHMQSYTKVLRIHRIRTAWSTKSLLRRKPPIFRLPVFKQIVKRKLKKPKKTTYAWHCTKQAQSWLTNQTRNHGVYIPYAATIKKPDLYLEIRGSF